MRKVSLPRIFLAFLPAVVLGSILYQSVALSLVYNSKGSFSASMIYFLTTRGIQFAVTIVIDAILTNLLFKTRVFERPACGRRGSATPERSKNISRKEVGLMNVNEAIAYIHSVCWKGSVPGLGRTQELLAPDGKSGKEAPVRPHRRTNGKAAPLP